MTSVDKNINETRDNEARVTHVDDDRGLNEYAGSEWTTRVETKKRGRTVSDLVAQR
jgi:hypothetical protein